MAMDTMTARAPFKQGVLGDGVEEIIQMAGAPVPCTVFINPAVGDTVSYWYSLDGGVSYTKRADVTAYTEDQLISSVTHLKFQRTAGTGTTSAYGVV